MEFTGPVIQGSKRAAALGFPTINLAFDGGELSGVYAARVLTHDRAFTAAAYADQKRKVLEAHIIDFSEDVYGQIVTIQIAKKIRESVVFKDNEALKKAIASDIEAVRAYFSHHI